MERGGRKGREGKVGEREGRGGEGGREEWEWTRPISGENRRPCWQRLETGVVPI